MQDSDFELIPLVFFYLVQGILFLAFLPVNIMNFIWDTIVASLGLP